MAKIYVEKLAERIAPMVGKDIPQEKLLEVIFAEAVKDLGVGEVRSVFLGDDFLGDVITLVRRIKSKE